MKKILYLNIASFTALCIGIGTAYLVLLNDNFLHISISSILSSIRNLEYKQHCIMLGLLPIYIALVIFGSATLGLYIGSRMKRLLTKSL